MKRVSNHIRLIAWLITASLLIACLPSVAEDSGYYSDWLQVGPLEEPVLITEDAAEIGVSLRDLDEGEAELEDGASVWADAQLQAILDFGFRTAPTPGAILRCPLPSGMRAEDTDWTDQPDCRWRISGGAIELSFPEDAGDAPEAQIAFAFTLVLPEADPGAADGPLDIALDFPGTVRHLSVLTAPAILAGTILTAEGPDYTFIVRASAEAGIPEGAQLEAAELTDASAYLDPVLNGLDIVEAELTDLRLFDLTIRADGERIEPAAPVQVELRLHVDGETVRVLHFPSASAAPAAEASKARRSRAASMPEPEVLEASVSADGMIFETGSFSVYAVAGITFVQQVTAGDGRTYQITVFCPHGAGIPENATLQVSEILPPEDDPDGTSPYAQRVAEAEAVLGAGAGSVTYARFFDITLTDEKGEPLQPAEGSRVDVKVELADAGEETDLRVVHFGAETEVLSAVQRDTEAGCVLTFGTGSFSVYGIVEAPEPVTTRNVQDVTELVDGTGFYLSFGSGPTYVSSELNTKGCFVETGSYSAAAVWFFEPAGSGYRLYTNVNGEKLYLKNTTGNEVGLSANSATAILVTSVGDSSGKFYLQASGASKWLQHSNGGGGVRFWTDNNNATNSQFTITYASSLNVPDDVYRLDGKNCGIAYNNNSTVAAALMSDAKTSGSQQRLTGLDLTIRPDVLTHSGNLLVAQDSDAVFWTFHIVDTDKYQITTTVDGETRYLTLSGTSLTLTDEPDANGGSVFTATPGTGANSGKWQFSQGNRALNFTGSAANGFNGGSVGNETAWMNLLEKSVLTEDDFQTYTAKKVSVSDNDNVYDGQKLILYTRIWNDTTKQYEFYVVDHDGTLVLAYDTGDGIEWVGSRVNTALWDFTIYYDANSGEENYFYEFENDQYGGFIVPQAVAGQVLSGSTVGVNLNGRRYGRDYSTIIAWDGPSYAYSGLKTEDGHVVPCKLSEAEDFYFAVVQLQEEEELTTVDTVDNNQYGISMKMIDYNDVVKLSGGNIREASQKNYFNGDNNNAGLLSTNLVGDYPVATSKAGSTGVSLGTLYSGAETVNHLFIRSIHNESGYFEYDSTSNFAHLNSDGNFTVYDQLGAISNYPGQTGTGRHGQFMPYDVLTPGEYCSFTNTTSVTAQELSDLNPRKGERLYNIGSKEEVDYFFGMELSASFTQTPSGLDAWGHDIVFEFSGDDDFWLYVDGELVLDLGGVHSAMTGSVNFRTGIVKSSRGDSTLYEVFRNNYVARGLSETEIEDLLADKFTQNQDGQYVFKDYSNHDMRIFYMERGSGASNLHMRFNLAAVRPGTFILSKTLSGTEDADNDLIEFPYQVWYKTREDGETHWYLLGETVGNGTPSAVYQGTSVPVTFLDSFTPAGGTEAYENVFVLKPGESAEFTLPEDATLYRVVECGVNPDIYDRVTVNGDPVTGTDTANTVGGTARQDYKTTDATLEDRTKVEFDNHVKDGAMRSLRITKRLFDVDGVTPLHYPDNNTTFSFRLYLGNENADPDSLPLAYLYVYHVLDDDGNYCRWDIGLQEFVSLGTGDYASLTEEQKESATFTSSMYGSISRIPADYTVEVRNLIIGTQYKVEERGYEVPRGYTLRTGDGYTRVDVDPDITTGDTPYTGTMMREETPEIEVRNQKGWGLTVKKVWTDADFMSSHDTIYFAVYLNTESGPVLYEGSVRALTTRDSDVYIFFDDLTYDGWTYDFDDFVVREVILTGSGITTDLYGVVTGYDTITPIEEGGALPSGGVPTGKWHEDYTYTVHYEVGMPTGHNENVREDTVTNSRPGIPLYKTDEAGNGLAGAVFTLTDEQGETFAAESYTSGADGLITIAYLAEGSYILTETVAPEGYVALDEPVTIAVDAEGGVFVTPPSDLIQTREDPEGKMIAIITIQDRPTGFHARKVDADTLDPLEGIHFALYRQVTTTEGEKRKDYLPMQGYEDLVSDENGIIPRISMDLGPGTYYLTETRTLENYKLLGEDICFTIGADGTVTLAEGSPDWLERSESDGNVSYSLIVRNRSVDAVSTVITGEKTLKGRDMRAGEFTFTLTPVDLDGQPLENADILTTTAPAAADGQAVSFSFARLTFKAADYRNAAYRDSTGAYFYYIVAEDISENADENGFDSEQQLIYDQSRFLVVIHMTFDGEAFDLDVQAYPYDGNGVPEHLRPVESVTHSASVGR